MRLGQWFESARLLSNFPAKAVETASPRHEHRGFASSTSAVEFPKAWSLALAFYEWLQGTAGGVGESSGIERLTDGPEFRWVRHLEKASLECREVVVGFS
jgi:hypothetical protein